MTGIETLKALKGDVDRIVKDIPMWHIVRGVQILNKGVYVRYFQGQRLEVKGRARIKEMIETEIFKKDSEPVSQLIMTLWTRSSGLLYHTMYQLVKGINEEVDKIEKIEDDKANEFFDVLLKDFDKDRIFWCIVFNEVKFSKAVIEARLGRAVPFEVWPPAPSTDEAEGQEKAAINQAAEQAMKTPASSLFNLPTK